MSDQEKKYALLKIIITNISSIPLIIAFFGALVFIPAGDIAWINGWLFLASLFIYLLLNSIYFIVKDPSTLEKRSKLSGEKGDSFIVVSIGVLLVVIILIPALDYRFNWSRIPFFVSCIGLICLIISYLIIFLVMRENSFASKGLVIHEGQKVITTGLYSHVRHPLYMGGVIMSIAIPVTLDSLISLVPAVFLPFIYAARIRKEEQMLLGNLAGYDEYMEKVKYRLFPGIW